MSSPAEAALGRGHEEPRLRLLLIEDDPNDAELVQACLAEAVRAGAEIVHAATLAEGLRALQSQAFHVTVLDLDLPDSAGFDTLERLSAAARSPIIVVTGNPHPALATEALKRRAYEVLPKSELDARSLMRLVRLASQHGGAERSPQLAERRYPLIDDTREAIGLFDAHGALVYGNPALRRLLWSEPSLLELAHPADRDALRTQYADLAAMRDARLTLEAHFRHHDGSWRMLEVALHNRLQDRDVAAVVASFTDITSQVDLEERFRATFDQAAVGIAHLAEDGRFQLVNRKLCDILGYAREELTALTVFDVSHPDDRDVTLALRRKMRAHEIDSFSVIKRYLRKDGSSVWAEVNSSLVRTADGAPRYSIALFEDISARRQAEEALQRSERRFRALIENSSDGILLTDGEARITYGSPGARRTLGYDKGETLGWQIADMVDPQDRAVFDRMTAAAAEAPGVPQALHARVRHKSGRYRLLEGSCTDLRADESVRAVVYNFRDVTVREEALERAQRLSLMYAALGSANEAILRAKSPLELLSRVCEITVAAGNFVLVTSFMHQRESGLLKRVAASGPASAFPLSDTPAPDSIVAAAWRAGEVTICNDYQSDPRAIQSRRHPRAFPHPLAACAVWPLFVDGEAVGVFSMLHAEKDAFSDEINQLLRRLAENLSFALASFAHEERRLQAERELRESEERFRNLTELSSDWYWEQDKELRFTRVYGGFFARLAIDPQTLLGKRRWDIPAIDAGSAEWRVHREALTRRESFRDFEHPMRLPGGDWGYVSVSGHAVFDQAGMFRGYRGTGRDITARRRAEEQLRRFRAALNASAESIFLVDADAMQIIDLNDAAARLLGYERDAMIGADPAIMFEGRDADVRAEYERLSASPDAAQSFRAHFRRRDGTAVPVEGSRRLLRAFGRNYVVGIARDITERLKAEERLQQSLERFEIVARATNDVVWDWNLLTDQLWWNDNFCGVFGYDAAEVGAYIDSWTARIHPEDAARVKQDIKSAIERGERVWTAEYRFRRKDGSYANVFDRGLPLLDRAGRPVRMIGAMVDITERKRAERKMALHAQRQEIIARLGQFALGGADLEQVLAEAARVLRAGGCDVAAIIERVGERGYEFVVRAARGEGAEESVGKSKVLPAHSKWATLLESGGGAVEHDRKYFEARDADRPWSFWLRRLGSGVYAPIRSETGPFGILMMGSLRDAAFDGEDLSFAEAIAHVLSSAVRRHQTQTRLAYMAEFDTLTGLPNRNLLQDRLNQSLAQARRRQWQGAVLFIDLDRFKLINDTLGHHIGDRLIAEVGRRIRQSVRGGDTVGRVSGDEFGVVLTDLAQADDAAIVAQKILDALARPFDLGGNETYVTASIGISVFPGDGDDAETLLKNADMAMYRAKELTRNAYCFFTAEMNQRSVAKLQLNTQLRHAVERGEFMLYYQPKVGLRDGSLQGVEALLRWNHPLRGMVLPDEFIPALEDSGLILTVGEWVLGEAARQLGAWQREGLQPVPVAVNLSARQFRRRDLDALIRGVLTVTGVPAGLLELEITESCLMDEPEEALRLLANLRAAGLKISVDDFGTGYSSLSYLMRLPLTALKIDRSFVRNAARSAEAASIVRAIIDMAHNLGFTVIAEGVETEEQAAFLRGHGCDLGQGFVFDQPMPAAELARRLGASPGSPRA